MQKNKIKFKAKNIENTVRASSASLHQQINCKCVGATSGRPKSNGITLVALVITIIVMLILIGVTVSTVLKGDLFNIAKKASVETRASMVEEKVAEWKSNKKIDEYLEEKSNTQSLEELLNDLETQQLITNEERKEIEENMEVKIGDKEILFYELPEGYVELEYLESTGTQYIDTGLKVSNKTKVELVGKQYTSASSLFGVNPLFVITSSQSTDRKKQLCRFRYNNTTQDTDVNILELSKITFDKNKGYINDVLLATFTETTFSSTYNAILFGRRINSSGALEELAQQRIDYFKMWENDVLVRDMIPCLDNNGTPCMYDTVSRKTFYNQGTGTFGFKVKATIPNNYTLCDYLESTGTQYIDTGFIPTNKSKSIVDMQCTDWTSIRANFFGASDYTINARFNVGMNSAKTYFQWNIADEYFTNIRVKTTDRVTITMDAINHSITFGTDTIIKDTPNYDLINDGTFTFWLFGANGAYNSYCKIFSCNIYDDNKLLLNMIPCLDSNGKPCMYDSVSKQSFYNQGTGEFLYAVAK